jgi:hypothetical protein
MGKQPGKGFRTKDEPESGLPEMVAAEPTVIPAREETIFDRYHFIDIYIRPGPENLLATRGNPIDPPPWSTKLSASKVCYLPDGRVIFSPLDEPVEVRLEDLRSFAADKPDLQQAIATIVSYGKQLFAAEGHVVGD